MDKSNIYLGFCNRSIYWTDYVQSKLSGKLSGHNEETWLAPLAAKKLTCSHGHKPCTSYINVPITSEQKGMSWAQTGIWVSPPPLIVFTLKAALLQEEYLVQCPHHSLTQQVLVSQCKSEFESPHHLWLCPFPKHSLPKFLHPSACECEKFQQIILHKVGFECLYHLMDIPTTKPAFIEWQNYHS